MSEGNFSLEKFNVTLDSFVACQSECWSTACGKSRCQGHREWCSAACGKIPKYPKHRPFLWGVCNPISYMGESTSQVASRSVSCFCRVTVVTDRQTDTPHYSVAIGRI